MSVRLPLRRWVSRRVARTFGSPINCSIKRQQPLEVTPAATQRGGFVHACQEDHRQSRTGPARATAAGLAPSAERRHRRRRDLDRRVAAEHATAVQPCAVRRRDRRRRQAQAASLPSEARAAQRQSREVRGSAARCRATATPPSMATAPVTASSTAISPATATVTNPGSFPRRHRRHRERHWSAARPCVDSHRNSGQQAGARGPWRATVHLHQPGLAGGWSPPPPRGDGGRGAADRRIGVAPCAATRAPTRAASTQRSWAPTATTTPIAIASTAISAGRTTAASAVAKPSSACWPRRHHRPPACRCLGPACGAPGPRRSVGDDQKDRWKACEISALSRLMTRSLVISL